MVSFATSFPSSSMDKKAKSSPRKVEHENLAQFRSKQTLASAIAKQFTNKKTAFDINKILNVEKVCLGMFMQKRRETLELTFRY